MKKTLPVCVRCRKPTVNFIQKSGFPSFPLMPCASQGGSGAFLLLHHFTRPWPSRFPAELGCSLNFQCWFNFLQWYHMLLCKQSTWSGQTKEHVCSKPSPYRWGASSAGRGPGLHTVIFHPVSFRLRRERGGLPLCFFQQRSGNSCRTRTAGSGQASLKLLRFHFTSDRLHGDSLLKDHSLGTLSGGRGPELHTAVKTTQTGVSGTSARPCLG